MESARVTRTYARRKTHLRQDPDSSRGGAETLLPAILVHIFTMLPPLELLRLPAVCRAWKRVLHDPASRLLTHLQHTAPSSHAFAITEVGNFGKAQRRCWVLNHGMTKWSAVDYPAFLNRRSPGFGPDESIFSVASHGGFLFFYVTNSQHFKSFLLVWNPVTKSAVGLHSLERSHPFINGASELLLDFEVHEETAVLSAVVDDVTQTMQLDYWFHCNSPQYAFDPYGSKMAKVELKYEPGTNSAARPWADHPRSPPYRIFDDNLVDKTFWRKWFFTIFCEYSTERRRRCSFHLCWSTDGYIPKVAGRADRRESRIVIPFGLVVREHDFDKRGSLVVFQDRLFFVVHGCDVRVCNHIGEQCGSQIHVIEVFPEGAGVRYVKVARMPLRYYNLLFSGDAVNERRRWPQFRGVWGATPHGDYILFHSWAGLRFVAFSVSAKGEDVADLAQGVMDEAKWTSVLSPHTEVAENMHVVSLELRLDATVLAF